MEKINVAELLKDCPKGMELNCTIFDGVKFDGIETGIYPIRITVPYVGVINLNKFGEHFMYTQNTKCIIFPKGKTSWEGFQRPFNDGDILYIYSAYPWIFIYKEGGEKENVYYKYAAITSSSFTYDCSPLCHRNNVTEIRHATEEEKQKLFQAIKDNGYKWNAETKTLENLIEPKFDITTLKPFDKVLVRNHEKNEWQPNFFNKYCKEINSFKLIGVCTPSYAQHEHFVNYCIPYEGNEHLLGTTDDCDEYFKTWK